MYRDFLHKEEKMRSIHHIQEYDTMEDMGRQMYRIYATLDNMEADHQTSIIEMDSKICDQFVSILIDTGYNYSYVNPDLVDKFRLNKKVHAKS